MMESSNDDQQKPAQLFHVEFDPNPYYGSVDLQGWELEQQDEEGGCEGCVVWLADQQDEMGGSEDGKNEDLNVLGGDDNYEGNEREYNDVSVEDKERMVLDNADEEGNNKGGVAQSK